MRVEGNLPLLIGIGALVAVAVWGILFGLITLLGGHQARVRARIKRYVTEEDQPAITEALQRKQLRQTLFSEMDSRWSDRSIIKSLFKNLIKEIDKADLQISLTESVLIQLGTSLLLALILWLVAPVFNIVFALLGFILGIMAFRSYLRFAGRRRITQFEEQLPDTLSILASSVRGGFSLFQALQLISTEAAEPSKTEFLRVIHEVSLGVSMEEALAGLARRIPTEDVEILVTAITLQHQTGGSLSHVLDVVATTVRERHRVQKDIQALTAQVRFSAILLAALPYLLAGVIFIISPLYMGRLFEWGWVLVMPIGAVIFSLIGLTLMRKIANIDV